MKKNDLKKLIKPIVKECIQEVLLEEGLLSNVVSEVAKGLQPQNVVIESREPQLQAAPRKSNPNVAEQRKKLLDAIGKDAYNGVDLFEGTAPISSQGPAKPGAIDLGESGDSGVDITSIMGNATKLWDMMK